MSSRQRRAVSGLLAASVAVFVALFSHVALGGADLPGMLGILVPWLLAVPVCVFLAGRSLSFVRLAASVVASQALFHALFLLGTPSAASGGTHSHGAAPVLDSAAPVAELASGSLMLGSHLLAAVVTVLALHFARRGVRLGLHAVRIVRLWLERFIPSLPAALAPNAVAAPTPHAPGILITLFLRAPVRRRGPPLLPVF